MLGSLIIQGKRCGEIARVVEMKLEQKAEVARRTLVEYDIDHYFHVRLGANFRGKRSKA